MASLSLNEMDDIRDTIIEFSKVFREQISEISLAAAGSSDSGSHIGLAHVTKILGDLERLGATLFVLWTTDLPKRAVSCKKHSRYIFLYKTATNSVDAIISLTFRERLSMPAGFNFFVRTISAYLSRLPRHTICVNCRSRPELQDVPEWAAAGFCRP